MFYVYKTWNIVLDNFGWTVIVILLNSRFSPVFFSISGHGYGPKSKNVKAAMSDIDDLLDKMQSKIKKAGLQDEVKPVIYYFDKY